MLSTKTATLFLMVLSLLAVLPACKPSPLKELGTIESFKLQDADGNTVNWSSFRGQPVLVFFGYTYCPDFCPMTLHKIEKAYKASESSDWPTLLFISVDPERDTPAALKEYLGKFSFPSRALTGSEEELRLAAKRFGVTFYQDPANPELMQHSPVLFLIDEDATIRYLFKFSQTADELTDLVNAL
ncbi:MAG: SCO family protein [Leptospiraceae bacterium]|nr:SCO family protein [Leptospiraceae bacterium]